MQAPPQLVHGDLTGNLLFHTSLPPAVIDLSPYWRPTALFNPGRTSQRFADDAYESAVALAVEIA